MKTLSLLILSVCVVFVITLFSHAHVLVAQTFTFSKDLGLGSNSVDVQILQKTLNSVDTTRVADFGDGAPGYETTHFGTRTKNAVMSFQKLHNISPTGFVGPITRGVLNNLTSLSSNNNAVIADTVNKPTTQTKKVFVYTTNSYQVLPNSSVTLTGKGFTPDSNTVHVGENIIISNISTTDNAKITFALPSNAQLGKNELWVENANGSSRSSETPIYIFITSTPLAVPSITSISPETVSKTGQVTITGQNFTNQNNIYSTVGDIKNVSSADGTTITFNVKDFSRFKGKEVNAWVYVQNERGVTPTPMQIKIKL